jgi:hypothetical protein
MSRILALTLALGVLTACGAEAADDGPAETVRLARSWDEALAEAKLLNVPIVVHSHGFYCGPCWGMHSAVLENTKYREFAETGTVEVLCLSRLDEGIEKGDPRAATYEGQRNGKPVQMMVNFPGLTADEVNALNASKAGRYNDTGGIPVTTLVNPHTEEAIIRWQGGTSAKTIIEAATEARATLEKEHGEGFPARTYAKFLGAEDDAWQAVAKGDFTKALKEVDAVLAKSEDWPEVMKTRGEALRRLIVEAAAARLDEIEAQSSEDLNRAKADLRKLLAKLKGTGLEERAKTLLETL